MLLLLPCRCCRCSRHSASSTTCLSTCCRNSTSTASVVVVLSQANQLPVAHTQHFLHAILGSGCMVGWDGMVTEELSNAYSVLPHNSNMTLSLSTM